MRTAGDFEVAAAGSSPLRRLRGLVKRGQEFMRVRRSLLRTLSGVQWASRVKAVDPEGFYLGKIGLVSIPSHMVPVHTDLAPMHTDLAPVRTDLAPVSSITLFGGKNLCQNLPERSKTGRYWGFGGTSKAGH